MFLPGLHCESLSSCFMFFVALSLERGPKRWDPDCRCVSGASFCLGAAVGDLCGLQRGSLSVPRLWEPQSPQAVQCFGCCGPGSCPRTWGCTDSTRCSLGVQEAARTPHQMKIASLFLWKPQGKKIKEKSFSRHSSLMPRQR